MATLTNQEIEQLKQQFKEKQEEVRELYDKLIEAGAWPLDDDELDGVAGGVRGGNTNVNPPYIPTDNMPFGG